MEIKQEHHDLVKAIAARNVARVEQFDGLGSKDDQMAFDHLLAATCSLILEHHFKGEFSPEAVTMFVDDVIEELEEAHPVSELTALEKMIRAACTDQYSFDDVESDDLIDSYTLLVIVRGPHHPEIQENPSKFLSDAENLANQRIRGS